MRAPLEFFSKLLEKAHEILNRLAAGEQVAVALPSLRAVVVADLFKLGVVVTTITPRAKQVQTPPN
jgi:hypothetical protein